MFDIDIPGQWSRGSVVLIGDAAHAMTPALGQGANIGLEDSTELAHCIGLLFRTSNRSRRGEYGNGNGGDLPLTLTSLAISRVLNEFWQGRIDRVRRVHTLSRMVADERNKGISDYKVDRSFTTTWKPSFLS